MRGALPDVARKPDPTAALQLAELLGTPPEDFAYLGDTGIDMETATLFIVGHYNRISRGALLLVSDVPITPEGVKTEESDAAVTEDWADIHLQIGIEAMTEIDDSGEAIRHFRY